MDRETLDAGTIPSVDLTPRRGSSTSTSLCTGPRRPERCGRSGRNRETVTAFGPRGRNVVHPGADWRLFVGDDTALPGILAMIETLPSGSRAHALIEVQSDEDRQGTTTTANVSVEWLSRHGAVPMAMSLALVGRLAALSFPSGRGHVYLLGETSTIRRQRHELIARGLGKDQIFGEGYWRPGRIGGHDHLEEHH